MEIKIGAFEGADVVVGSVVPVVVVVVVVVAVVAAVVAVVAVVVVVVVAVVAAHSRYQGTLDESQVVHLHSLKKH